MRSLSKLGIIFMLILLMTSCATTKSQIPQKYMLDGQLERVSEVTDIRAGRTQPGFTIIKERYEEPQSTIDRRDTVTFYESKNQWIKVDMQSFILQSAPGLYYLLVLHAPNSLLMSTDAISFTLPLNTIKAGVEFLDLGGKFLVEKIYKIESTQQMHAIKNQLMRAQNLQD